MKQGDETYIGGGVYVRFQSDGLRFFNRDRSGCPCVFVKVADIPELLKVLNTAMFGKGRAKDMEASQWLDE